MERMVEKMEERREERESVRPAIVSLLVEVGLGVDRWVIDGIRSWLG